MILLTVVPLVELTLLLKLAEGFGWRPTIALVLVTGALGAWLARREGLKTLGRIQADLAAGVPPTDALVEGALIVAAGLVLVTPGILTDAVGFALLIGPIRRRVRRRLTEAFKRRVVVLRRNGAGHDPPRRTEFIDVAATGKDLDESADDPRH